VTNIVSLTGNLPLVGPQRLGSNSGPRSISGAGFLSRPSGGTDEFDAALTAADAAEAAETWELGV